WYSMTPMSVLYADQAASQTASWVLSLYGKLASMTASSCWAAAYSGCSVIEMVVEILNDMTVFLSSRARLRQPRPIQIELCRTRDAQRAHRPFLADGLGWLD